MPGHPFYGTQLWKAARAAALKRARYMCEACGVDVKGLGRSRVDHKQPRASHPELALEPSNLRVLCVACDGKRHAGKASGQPAGHWEDKRGANARGYPTSPAHPWNRPRGAS